MTDSLAAIRIVLCRPKDAENVGSVCRAMKTMGITDLRLVAPGEFDKDRAAAVAVHAACVFHAARRYERIADAVSDASFVVGATRRWGKNRKNVRFTPAELAGWILSHRGASVAVIFGNESSGLSNEELAVCHAAVTIPSEAMARSLNLSHAVQIICYEIYSSLHRAEGKRFYTPISGDRLDRTVAALIAVLNRAGISGTDAGITGASSRYEPLIRDVLARAALSTSEAKRLTGLFEKLDGLLRAREKDS